MAAIMLAAASEKDIPELRKLALATWEPTYKNILSREQLLFMEDEIYNAQSLALQMSKGQQYYFINAGLETVGFLSVSPLNPEQNRFKLNKLYLLPAVQGMGFGKKTIEAVATLSREKGGKALELNVNKFNPAKTFYEHCGFSVIREEDIPIGKYWMNDFVMELKLA